MKIYEMRRARLYELMKAENIDLLMFEDTEGQRDAAIRHLSGQPSDAVLFLARGQSLLMPWDVNMANKLAQVDKIIPYNDCEKQPLKALEKALSYFDLGAGARLELEPDISHLRFVKYADALKKYELVCRVEGLHNKETGFRTCKDAEEVRIYRKLAELTNEVLILIEKKVLAGSLKTEVDVALFIEAESRKMGCEGTSFDTLVAGPSRSFGIHAFPSYTAAPFVGKGLAILDFGLKYQGYASDVTVTFVQEPSSEQEKLVVLVQEAWQKAFSLVKPGVAAREVASGVAALFAEHGRKMPHALGHGVGLDIHEEPRLNDREDNKWTLEAGMVFTLEPGLYDPLLGGCRLENDVLVGPSGPEVLTSAHIIKL